MRSNLLKQFSLFVCLAVVFALWGLVRAEAAAGPEAPNTLRCEYMDDPVGVDTADPRFAWILAHSERAEKQTAYQVLVATKPELLKQDHGDQWDSGKVTSDDFTQVVYAGKALKSGRNYWWKVRYWDKEGRQSEYSRTARFGTALLKSSEWKASWIGGGSAKGNEFRKVFTIQGKVANARIYVAALGNYELRVNGHRIGHKVLDPAWTTYPKRVLYSTYDLTSALKEGPNVIAVMLGGGWATQEVDGSEVYYKQPAVLVQMNAELEGGKQVSVITDGSWKTAAGPVVESSVYGGEVYDARQETPGWDQADFDETGWTAAQVVDGSAGARSSEMMPPIQVVDEIIPVKMTTPQLRRLCLRHGPEHERLGALARRRPRGNHGDAALLRTALRQRHDQSREHPRREIARHLHPARRRRRELRGALHLSRLPLRGGDRLPRHAESRFAARRSVVHTAVKYRRAASWPRSRS